MKVQIMSELFVKFYIYRYQSPSTPCVEVYINTSQIQTKMQTKSLFTYFNDKLL